MQTQKGCPHSAPEFSRGHAEALTQKMAESAWSEEELGKKGKNRENPTTLKIRPSLIKDATRKFRVRHWEWFLQHI